MQWDYRKIEYFLKTAELLNFSKAARELFISPQSLNKQIIKLEQELGEPLFERTTRHVALTAFGRRLKDAFEPVQIEFQRASAMIEKDLTRKRKALQIAFFQPIPKNEAVMPLTQFLTERQPGLQVNLMSGELDEILDWLYQGKCDLVITNLHEFETLPDVEQICFVRKPAMAVVSPNHSWAGKSKLTMEELEDMPILLLERTSKESEKSFYRRVRAKERLYTANFSSMLANLSTQNCYAVFPQIFENMSYANLRYLDLPEECRFDYQMVALYLKKHPRRDLFDRLTELSPSVFVEYGNL